MRQDKDTGAFHFSGDEDEVAMRWLWSCLLDTSFWGKVELTWRIWFKKPATSRIGEEGRKVGKEAQMANTERLIEGIRRIKPLMYVILWIAWRFSPSYNQYRTWWSIWDEYKRSL